MVCRNMDHYQWAATGDFPRVDTTNAMDSTEDTSVVSPCVTVLPQIVTREIFNRV